MNVEKAFPIFLLFVLNFAIFYPKKSMFLLKYLCRLLVCYKESHLKSKIQKQILLDLFDWSNAILTKLKVSLVIALDRHHVTYMPRVFLKFGNEYVR